MVDKNRRQQFREATITLLELNASVTYGGLRIMQSAEEYLILEPAGAFQERIVGRWEKVSPLSKEFAVNEFCRLIGVW